MQEGGKATRQGVQRDAGQKQTKEDLDRARPLHFPGPLWFRLALSSLHPSSSVPLMRKASFRHALRSYPCPRHASNLSLNPSVRVTTLPNKIRVATENTPGHFSCVGLYIDAGARYETLSSSGVSHFLDRMAFKVHPHWYTLTTG